MILLSHANYSNFLTQIPGLSQDLVTSKLAFYQESSSNFPWLYLPSLFSNIDSTLQVFQPFCIPIMIYQFTPYVSPKLFWFFSIQLIIITSFSFWIQFPIKLPVIILRNSVLSKPIYPSFIPSNFCCNRCNPLLQFFNNSTPNVSTLILFFLSNICQCLTLLTSLVVY